MHDAGHAGGGGTVSGDGYRIDFDAVEKIATRSDDVGNHLVELADYAANESAAARANHPGWALAGAIEHAQSTNEFNIQGFGRASCDMSDRLNAAMHAYRTHDDNVADELNGIGN